MPSCLRSSPSISESIFYSKLRNSFEFARKNAAHRRLFAREQSFLRPAHSANAAVDAALPAHPSDFELQKLSRQAALGLPPREGTGQRRTQRHRGFQLSDRRHGGCQRSKRGLLSPDLPTWRPNHARRFGGGHSRNVLRRPAGRFQPCLCGREGSDSAKSGFLWRYSQSSHR